MEARSTDLNCVSYWIGLTGGGISPTPLGKVFSRSCGAPGDAVGVRIMPVAGGQGVVALSTCEAEFLGQTQPTKEAVWLRGLLNKLNMDQETTATVIFGDNQGAIALASNPQYHSRTKHMEIQRKWQGEIQDSGGVQLGYVPTTEQIADGFTKPWTRQRFEWFRRELGIE